MKTKVLVLVLMIPGMIICSPCRGQYNRYRNIVKDTLYLGEVAMNNLKSANIASGITIALGLASNIEMALIGGFPMEENVELSVGVVASHMIFSLGRWGFSIPPPVQVSKARKALAPWRESPRLAPSCKNLFAYLDAAQALTIAAPLLSISGGILMFAASTQHSHNFDSYPYETQYGNKTMKTIGWVMVGAGLASSIAGSVMITLSKKELQKTMGTFKLSASPSGLGMIYKLP